MNAVFDAYLAAHRRRRGSPLTTKALIHALSRAQAWLDQEGIDPAQWSLVACEEYFDVLLDRLAVSTTRRHLAYVRAAYQYGIRHELCGRDPTADVRLPRLPDHDPAVYSGDEIEAIHAAIRTDREHLTFLILALAALRLGETAALQWPQVSLELKTIRLVGKGGKYRIVPIHPRLAEALAAHQPTGRPSGTVILSYSGQPVAPATLGREIRSLLDRAGVDIDSPCHAFRRTAATEMYEAGVRTRVIERIMGWAPRRMYERHYLRVSDHAMHEAILTLYPNSPLSGTRSDKLPSTSPPAPPNEQPWLSSERTLLRAIEQTLER